MNYCNCIIFIVDKLVTVYSATGVSCIIHNLKHAFILVAMEETSENSASEMPDVLIPAVDVQMIVDDNPLVFNEGKKTFTILL